MSSLNADFSYDGDAGAVSEGRPSLTQGEQMMDSIHVGNGVSGEFDDDTTGALTGTTVSAGRKNVLGRRRSVAGSTGLKTIHPKAGGQPITKNRTANSRPTSSSASVQDFVDASSSVDIKQRFPLVVEVLEVGSCTKLCPRSKHGSEIFQE